ncbi:MAG: hypothetical protein LBF56_02965 [Holosporales bacterium]|jgi:hypothetical protein|nr:hypothetical protein [Holosporales bacterium]
MEEFVIKAIRKLLTNLAITALTVHKLSVNDITLRTAQQAIKNIDKVRETLHFQEYQRILKLLVKSAVVDNEGVRVLLNYELPF